mmetsp:Transcript_5027/g.13363  ORF Transcript_5027/g.13363 Transcript_5027/m.13363 type:complete len:95 (+) Transcript_5027:138-422(+)|eukprot:CAMPEP_0198135034 /NCGR_PEP_ID=MMETSP1442-20131203/60379_1 /TAXON_ID= /ORGANISM="Craspedostauros australis, Strain CCMP3328" /LENGTH=94 /DNA_ID=CAMNT_0043796193 /DNA_START=616 /DNA_END=900 /DNA_ORIENTATION=-
MSRVLFFLALVVVAAQAFVAPAGQALSSPAFVSQTAPKVNMMENLADFSASNAAASSQLVASNVSDFGGYLFPVFGILGLAALILYLAPPLVDE